MALDAGDEPHPRIAEMMGAVSVIALANFTLEIVLKDVAEGRAPWRFFTHPENGHFNSFDFAIVLASYGFLGSSSGGAVGALRMLRLVRLLTFIKVGRSVDWSVGRSVTTTNQQNSTQSPACLLACYSLMAIIHTVSFGHHHCFAPLSVYCCCCCYYYYYEYYYYYYYYCDYYDY